jgi:hypothetical protein
MISREERGSRNLVKLKVKLFKCIFLGTVDVECDWQPEGGWRCKFVPQEPYSKESEAYGP